ncbi:hypothetical protein JG688_00017771 [Phytophthora aleatoria]|uniref:DDE-1 domain-containing protein n=1 Tax=Phytophthora aleatoria TaxID=2496075 RepID=A0A8J5LV42_9STRA|nr:hypothetical protein JG688_00017771 [Phytophthora aleatoria]
MKKIAKRGEKIVWVRCSGASKERVTTMLLGDSGGNKYTPFVVMKAKPSKIKNTRTKHQGQEWVQCSDLERHQGDFSEQLLGCLRQ